MKEKYLQPAAILAAALIQKSLEQVTPEHAALLMSQICHSLELAENENRSGHQQTHVDLMGR